MKPLGPSHRAMKPRGVGWLERNLREAEHDVALGERAISAQRSTIERIEAAGGSATNAREALRKMERLQLQLTVHRDWLAEAIDRPAGAAAQSHTPR